MKLSNETDNNRSGTDLILHYLRSMKHTQRLHQVRLIQRASLAEHCYYVGLLFEEIALREQIETNGIERYYAFRHDLLEVVTGDISYPVKHLNGYTYGAWELIEAEVTVKFPVLGPFSDSEMRESFSEPAWGLLTSCDLYEFYLFINEEIDLGNHQTVIFDMHTNVVPLLLDCGVPYIVEKVKLNEGI